MRPTVVFDMEVYTNYTLLFFKNVAAGSSKSFELPLSPEDLVLLRRIVSSSRLVTFNGIGYDIPLLMLILKGQTSVQIKYASNRIIEQNLRWWHFEKEFNVKCFPEGLDHVDIMEVAPLSGSLKLYAARLHCRSIQDLPIEHTTLVNEEQKQILRTYCENDCDNTITLFKALKVQIELREGMSKTYGIDLRSKSDAQVAEAVIKKECEALLKQKLVAPSLESQNRFHYQIPAWMSFRQLDILDDVRKAWFLVDGTGKVLIPKELSLRDIVIAGRQYRMGIGGLHSKEKRQIVKADEGHLLIDFDVASYYPAILLNQKLYPKHIGPAFLTVYQRLVDQRLAAKKAGNKAVSEALKIAINGTFGKTSSRWSVLYAPELFIQIVITGQLAILMLIEMLAALPGVEVTSGNTDGVTIWCAREAEPSVKETVAAWEMITEFETERVDYSAVYSRDVSNYIAIKTDGGTKEKGVYGTGLPLHKNPNARICAEAVIDYLQFDVPLATTIHGCQDLRQFVCVRKVEGGAIWKGEELGKITRWYYSCLDEEPFRYKTNGNMVPKTIGAVPLVTMPETLPVDLDYDVYIAAAQKMLTKELGVT